MTDKVMYRVLVSGVVVSVFPEIAASGRDRCETFGRDGHGAADLQSLVKSSRPAEPHEYAALADDLLRLGRKLKIIKRDTPATRAAREACCYIEAI